MTVSIAVTNRRVDLDVEERPEDRERPDDDDDVVEQRDERGHAELHVAEPVRDPGTMPSEPTTMRMNAWLIRSELTTGPIGRQPGLLDDRAELGLERRSTISPSLPLGRQLGVADRGRDGDGRGDAEPGDRMPTEPASPTARARPTRSRRGRRCSGGRWRGRWPAGDGAAEPGAAGIAAASVGAGVASAASRQVDAGSS